MSKENLKKYNGGINIFFIFAVIIATGSGIAFTYTHSKKETIVNECKAMTEEIEIKKNKLKKLEKKGSQAYLGSANEFLEEQIKSTIKWSIFIKYLDKIKQDNNMDFLITDYSLADEKSITLNFVTKNFETSADLLEALYKSKALDEVFTSSIAEVTKMNQKTMQDTVFAKFSLQMTYDESKQNLFQLKQKMIKI